MNDSHSPNALPTDGNTRNWTQASPTVAAPPSSADVASDSAKASGAQPSVTRVSIPNIGGNNSNHQPWKGPKTADALAAETERRLNMLSQAAASEGHGILDIETSSPALESPFDRLPNFGDAAFATQSSIAGRDSIDGGKFVQPSPVEAPTFAAANDTDELESVVDAILDRFPIQQPVGLVFTSSGSDFESDRVAADISDRLVKRRIGKVLLIDSHAETRELSKSSGGLNAPGLTDALMGQAAWQASVQSTAATGLEFLPFGTQPIKSTFTEQYRGLLREFKQYFQFVCISAGCADSQSVAQWAQVADGGYLIVNLQCSDQGQVKQAAEQLKKQHLEVLGCIATDVS